MPLPMPRCPKCNKHMHHNTEDDKAVHFICWECNKTIKIAKLQLARC